MEVQTDAVDPVCGMRVHPSSCPTVSYEDRNYYFCCQRCADKFRQNPTRYLQQPQVVQLQASPVHGECCGGHVGKQNQASTVGDDPAAEYTCPMHPEVQQIGPGTCPICGMDLEPKLVSADDTHELATIREMRIRFIAAAVLTIPVMGLSMGGMVGLDPHRWIQPLLGGWLQWGLTTAVLIAGWPLLVRGYSSLRTGNLNMFTLIALGSQAAYGFSIFVVLFPNHVPAAFQTEGHLPLYFEAAAVIITLVLFGQYLELRARRKTGSAIRELMELTPQTVIRLSNGHEQTVPLAEVAVGDLLRIRPGDRIPVDGHVVDGSSLIDQSMLTGEPIPVPVRNGDNISAGTINQTGALQVRADKVGSDTVLSHIVQMVAQAQRTRAPIQRLADLVAMYFVPLVIAVAVLAFLAWSLWGPQPRLAHAFVAAVAVLIVACPCALGLATPMSIMVGVGRGAREGILIRDAEALETLSQVDTLVVDKTGTVTVGKPAVTSVVPDGDWDADHLLALAATAEASSEHPLGAAIVSHAQARGIPVSSHQSFQSMTGEGITAVVEQREVTIGNPRFLKTQGVSFDQADSTTDLDADEQQGATVVWMAVDGQLAGKFVIEDSIKETAPAAINELRNRGIRIVMLTGDSEGAANAVAKQLGISEVHARLSPQAKHDFVKQLKEQGRRVVMVGDGINDAPSLAAADVGVAMGTGAGIAIESAGITLVGGDLQAFLRAHRLSEATMRNIRQNLFFAFVYNALGVPVAAGALYPILGILLSPMVAAAAMSMSSVSVIANALRLRTSNL